MATHSAWGRLEAAKDVAWRRDVRVAVGMRLCEERELGKQGIGWRTTRLVGVECGLSEHPTSGRTFVRERRCKWANLRAGKKGACRASRLTGPVREA